MKLYLKNIAIGLRQKGLSYSEILSEVSVSKSTLSLWLRSVGLSKIQKQRLTRKKLESALRGGAAKKLQRIEKVEKIIEKAVLEVGEVSKRELWLAGTMLYWAEGEKEKGYNPGTGLSFCNSDPKMINVYLEWLKRCLMVTNDRIDFDIYLHETHKKRVGEFKSFWSNETKLPISFF